MTLRSCKAAEDSVGAGPQIMSAKLFLTAHTGRRNTKGSSFSAEQEVQKTQWCCSLDTCCAQGKRYQHLHKDYDICSAINCNVPLLFFRLIEKVKLESAACIVLIIVLFSVTACKTSLVSLGHLELISRATQRAFPWYLGPWRPLSQKPSGGCAVHICLQSIVSLVRSCGPRYELNSC